MSLHRITFCGDLTMRKFMFTLLAATTLSGAAFAQSEPFGSASAPLSAEEKASIQEEAAQIKRQKAAAARAAAAKREKAAAAKRAAAEKQSEPTLIEPTPMESPMVAPSPELTPAPAAPAPSSR